MKKQYIRTGIVSLALTLVPVLAQSQSDSPAVSVGGFIRADAGFGDRYGNANGEDRMGVSKAALSVVTEYQNIQGVFVAGTEVTSELRSDTDGNVDIKDAFIVVEEGQFKLSVGAQPLLFGLKAAGYPGDHSIQESIEFGAQGVFPVANQAGPAAIGSWKFAPGNAISMGIFDARDYTPYSVPPALATDGSSFSDNVFIQWRADDIAGSGLYAVLGAESRYLGGPIDDSREIATAGVGWKTRVFDVSAEVFTLDQAFNGTADDDEYLVLEAAYLPTPQSRLYLDYSESDQLEVETIRGGYNYNYNDYLMVTVEASKDDIGNTSVDSVDLRLTLSY